MKNFKYNLFIILNIRNGMLQTGDRILFIDNTSLRNKTINEINHLLKFIVIIISVLKFLNIFLKLIY